MLSDLRAVEEGISVRQAARMTNVSRMILADRVKAHGHKSGQGLLLSDQDE